MSTPSDWFIHHWTLIYTALLLLLLHDDVETWMVMIWVGGGGGQATEDGVVYQRRDLYLSNYGDSRPG